MNRKIYVGFLVETIDLYDNLILGIITDEYAFDQIKLFILKTHKTIVVNFKNIKLLEKR